MRRIALALVSLVAVPGLHAGTLTVAADAQASHGRAEPGAGRMAAMSVRSRPGAPMLDSYARPRRPRPSTAPMSGS